MSYAFKHRKQVGRQIRTIATEQVDRALETVREGGDFDTAVHSLRKSTKKLRALLTLVRPGFDEYEAENAAIKAIARQFSVARDAAVMVETLSQILKVNRSESGAAAGLLDRLRERARHLKSQMGEETLLDAAGQELSALRLRIEGWRFDDKGSGAVLPGLRTSYRQFRDGLEAAQKQPNGEVIHEWRKAAKGLWYHTRLFAKSAPAVLKPQSQGLGQLCEVLGDHHNLTVLGEWIETSVPAGEATASLRDALERRRIELAERGFALGRQLAAEKPSAVQDRYRRYWALLE
ncbi:CHAD domain-containing protein [Devosia lucknowensis]|uniref:CHAD domain-containing protein n=1 Tax=Devosia lucknowensis TaxID=1096929 RepID=A0A1Y6EV46_9HYPH|nr:CHAD domain-containing protein [Devosia lucknowensis]SMQ66166.1 CHAD domain-containing protein [Devosia lucknowensis]